MKYSLATVEKTADTAVEYLIRAEFGSKLLMSQKTFNTLKESDNFKESLLVGMDGYYRDVLVQVTSAILDNKIVLMDENFKDVSFTILPTSDLYEDKGRRLRLENR